MSARRLRAAAAPLAFALAGCGLTEGELKLPYSGYAPTPAEDGWTVSTPTAEGLDAAALETVYRELFDEGRVPTARALLVVRHGKLVAEAYARDHRDRDRVHHLQSATKSVTSLLTGVALDQGLIPSTQHPLFALIPEAFDAEPVKRGITLHHALSMQTGLEFDNDSDTDDLYHAGGSSLEFVLHRRLVFSPGTRFDYHDGNPQLVSGVVQKTSGATLEEFAKRHLFAPLGINTHQWEHAADGRTFGAFGLWLRPREMAKLGQLLMSRGTWQGRRVVSEAWLERATSRQTAGGDYGYYFWLWRDGSYSAEGHGGQIIRVWPALDLVVVLTADPYSDQAVLGQPLAELVGRVALAVRRP